ALSPDAGASFPAPFIQRKAGCACGGGCPTCQEKEETQLQTKIQIGHAADPAEREADGVAEQVMSNSHASLTTGAQVKPGAVTGASAGTVADASASAGAFAGASASVSASAGLRVSRLASSTPPSSSLQTRTAPPAVHEVLRSSGEPLDAATRGFMESRFGQDFGGVRVHSNQKAAESARAVNARAYTVGRDVVFGESQYAPNTEAGQKLLAHELAHVLQQGATAAGTLQREETTATPETTGATQTTGTATPPEESAATDAATSSTAPTGKCGVDDSCSASRCDELRKSLAEAQELVAAAKRDLEPDRHGGSLSERTSRVLRWHFHTSSHDAIARIIDTFGQLETRLNEGMRLFTCKDVGKHCYFLGFIPNAIAYTSQGDYQIVLCGSFFGSGKREQAKTLIHEAGHNVGLPRSPLDRDVYISGHEYRALSTEEALVTTDSYANFAHDNRYGIPFSIILPEALGEFRTGVAFTETQPQWMLSYGFTVGFSHPVFSLIYPVAGVEITYMPATGERRDRAITSATIGARIGARGQRSYFDMRAGVFTGSETRFRGLEGILTEVSAHYQPGSHDLSLFWQYYHSTIARAEDTMVFGIGGRY
ncbi:MAG TPA: DUF4157 domain-containing protein, partial [Pyrinomonadaceae bacterium]|nr:DUF4157 domain-containing protein [Pyrinomonadaceae bacterium]